MENTATKPESNQAFHRAKGWQIALFPFNNAATNLYFAFVQFFTFFAVMYLTGSTFAATGTVVVGVLAVQTFVGIFSPMMRILDGATDVVFGGILDRLQTRFGKFRPFMVIGNAALAFSLIFMTLGFIWVPVSWGRWIIFIVGYILFVSVYSLQTSVTRAGQSCLTNDPKQRSQFGMWNTIGMLGSIVLVNVIAMGLLPAVLPDHLKGSITYMADGVTHTLFGAAYGPTFYYIMVPLIVVLSAIYTVMAVMAIKDKDKPQYWGVSKEPVKVKDYVGVIKGNKELRWLVLSAGCNKLGSTIATSAAVAFLLFGALMGDYNGLYIPFYVLAFAFMGIFLIWGAKTGGRKGQKRAVTQFALLAIAFYIGVTMLLAIYNNADPSTFLSLYKMGGYEASSGFTALHNASGNFRLTINFYTILFIVLYGCGYGAFNVTDQMTIPMVADIIDYETYRSGKFVPGVVSTLFSFIDKLISSLQVLLLTVFIVYMVPGLEALPGETTPFMEGMQLATILTFCVIPIVTWFITLICMMRYKLSGQKLTEVQAVNAVRKVAIMRGMSSEQAMATWQTIDQVPAEFIPEAKRPFSGQMAELKADIAELKNGNNAEQLAAKEKELAELVAKVEKIEKKLEKKNWFDKLYQKIWSRKEVVMNEPSINAIPIPAEFDVPSDEKAEDAEITKEEKDKE